MKKIKIPKIDDLRRENSNISNVSNFWREKYPDFNLEIWQKLGGKKSQFDPNSINGQNIEACPSVVC